MMANGRKTKPLSHSVDFDFRVRNKFFARFSKTSAGKRIDRITSNINRVEEAIVVSDIGLPAAQVFQDDFQDREFLDLLEHSGYTIDTAKQYLGCRILGVLEQLDFEKVDEAPTKNEGPIKNGMVYQRSAVWFEDT